MSSRSGWYSERSCVYKRTELPGRSVKVKKVLKVDGGFDERTELRRCVKVEVAVLGSRP